MTNAQITAISNAMDMAKSRRQVICRYNVYGNDPKDLDWWRKKDYFVKDYPNFHYWVISW